jgi:opacity protein-like surface antigen
MNRALAIFAALACLTGAAAHAQDDDLDDELSRNGWYVGGYGVYAFEFYRDTGGVSFDNSTGANFRIGYRGYEWFALEAEVEWIEGFDATVPGKVEARTIIGGLNGKFYPLGGRYQPYVLIGGNGMNVDIDHKSTGPDDDETDWAFRMGLGLEIYATRHIVVGVEGSYVWALGDIWGADYTSVGAGVLFRF